MMTMTRTRAWGAILSVCWLAGCGGGGGSSANLGGFSSSIDGNDQINQLTSQQQQTLCSEVTSFAASSGLDRDQVEVLCRVSAILAASFTAPAAATDAQLRAACQSSYDMCKAQASPSDCNFDAATATCTATIAELAACVNDSLQTYSMALNEIPTCDKITAATLQSSASQTSATPASCATYQQKCPSQTMP
jgi:hypothetical protein